MSQGRPPFEIRFQTKSATSIVRSVRLDLFLGRRWVAPIFLFPLRAPPIAFHFDHTLHTYFVRVWLGFRFLFLACLE